MEAIILAGGFGTRLRPLTYTRAKSLLPIMNKAMVSHIIEMLPREVDKVILAVNYRKDQIEDYFQKNDHGKEIIINDEPKPLGTGGAVKFAENHITGRFLVLNSDIICSLDLEKMINFHYKKKSMTTISLWPVENVSEFGVVDVEKDGKIVGFVEKPKPEDAPSDLINAGAYCIEPEILNYIKTGRLVSMEKEIFPQIITDTDRFYGFKFEGYWMDIGRIKSYLDVHKFLLKKKNLDNFYGKKLDIKGEIENSCIGNDVEIDNNSKIESCVIFDNVKIDKDVDLKSCVIGESCIINESAKMKDCVIGDNEIIAKNQVINNQMIWTKPKPEGYPDKQIGNVIQR